MKVSKQHRKSFPSVRLNVCFLKLKKVHFAVYITQMLFRLKVHTYYIYANYERKCVVQA